MTTAERIEIVEKVLGIVRFFRAKTEEIQRLKQPDDVDLELVESMKNAERLTVKLASLDIGDDKNRLEWFFNDCLYDSRLVPVRTPADIVRVIELDQEAAR